MATFVLVHGAWHGGWCWWKVEPLLRQSGGSVYAPSLTGMGERSHLAGYIDPAAINLDLHIKDVWELLESEGLEEVILVGHAYAGMVITGVAEVCPQRLDHLVYVNGVVPRDGEAMVDQLDAVRGPDFTARVRAAIDNREEFLRPPSTVEEIRRRWGITDPEDQSRVLPRLRPQSVASFAQPVRLGSSEALEISRSFILSRESGFDPVAERVRQSDWGLYQLDTGHDPMITKPREVAEILLRISGGA
ncbi:MAG TPA: alpha/beta fold hydrolase [Dehalococcoidia bacterium]|nr:alpha/beta fold hydrolase [Dehalococcoidia bacterium]